MRKVEEMRTRQPNVNEVKMLREAIYVMRSDKKRGWLNARN